MQQGRSGGFTYLMLLWWVAVSSVLLAALSQSWAIEGRRQREMELVFRGEQIKAAIQSYRNSTPGPVKQLPKRLDDLLIDERGPVVQHHLRRLWPDPITGSSQWGLIREGEFILGVYSESDRRPLRAPAGVDHYADWRFELTQ